MQVGTFLVLLFYDVILLHEDCSLLHLLRMCNQTT